jgi:hypothetical protein
MNPHSRNTQRPSFRPIRPPPKPTVDSVPPWRQSPVAAAPPKPTQTLPQRPPVIRMPVPGYKPVPGLPVPQAAQMPIQPSQMNEAQKKFYATFPTAESTGTEQQQSAQSAQAYQGINVLIKAQLYQYQLQMQQYYQYQQYMQQAAQMMPDSEQSTIAAYGTAAPYDDRKQKDEWKKDDRGRKSYNKPYSRDSAPYSRDSAPYSRDSASSSRREDRDRDDNKRPYSQIQPNNFNHQHRFPKGRTFDANAVQTPPDPSLRCKSCQKIFTYFYLMQGK